MSILDTGIYEVDGVNALVYANRKRGKVLLKVNTLPTGYKQIVLFKGRNTGVKCILYLHQLVWLSVNDMYDETMTIDHIDGYKDNNGITNLRLLTQRDNSLNIQQPKTMCKEFNTIRQPEIKAIKLLMSLGYSQSTIAKELGLNRLSVRYTIKRIESGIPLKYE